MAMSSVTRQMPMNPISERLVAPDIGGPPPVRGDNPRYNDVVDKLVSPDATQEQRDRAYGLVAGIEERDQMCYTDEALTQKAAQAIADDRTIPVNVSEVAPLVPPGTVLGPFASSDAAAIAMMGYSNPLSIAANRENGGLVFRDPNNGQFYITTPMQGSLDGFDPSQVPQPAGLDLVGAYHGHADYSKADGTRTDAAGDEYDSNNFSPQDKRVTESGHWGDVTYVSTPNGSFRKYDAATHQDTRLN